MKSKLRTLVFGAGIATIGMVGGAGLTAIAAPGGEGPRERVSLPGLKLTHAMAKLDLTAEQQEMITDLRADIKADITSMHEDKRGGKPAMGAQFLAEGEVDRAAMHADLDADAAEKLALAHTVLDRVLDIRDTLTSDQLAELRDMAGQQKARRDQMKQRVESGDTPRPRRR